MIGDLGTDETSTKALVKGAGLRACRLFWCSILGLLPASLACILTGMPVAGAVVSCAGLTVCQAAGVQSEKKYLTACQSIRSAFNEYAVGNVALAVVMGAAIGGLTAMSNDNVAATKPAPVFRPN